LKPENDGRGRGPLGVALLFYAMLGAGPSAGGIASMDRASAASRAAAGPPASPTIRSAFTARDAGLGGHHAIVDADAYPWSAVGKLFNSVGGACTAAVIAPDKVLTAAHCLYAFRTHRFLEATAIHFLLGYARGDYRIHARVAAYGIGPGYDPANEARTAGSDWAVLTLAEPLPVVVRPIAVAQSEPPAGAAIEIEIGGFAQDRAYLMTADTRCRLTGRIVGGSLLSHDCEIQHGDSGAPLLVASLNGAVQAVGVTVGFWSSEGRQVRIAAPITADILPTAQARR